MARKLKPHASGLPDWGDAEIARAIPQGISRDGSARQSQRFGGQP